MAKYRKKPVVIEARQVGNDYDEDLATMQWCGGIQSDFFGENGQLLFHVPTLEGNMQVSLGDWVIQGIHGEFYPCKPDIFEATYEEAD